MTVEATIAPTQRFAQNLVNAQVGSVQVRTTNSLETPWTTATVDPAAGTVSVTLTGTLAPAIKFYNADDDAKAFKLDWGMRIHSTDSEIYVATTKHTVYVIGGNPGKGTTDAPGYLYESIPNIGCFAADGTPLPAADDPVAKQALADAIFAREFGQRDVSRAWPGSGSKLTDLDGNPEKMLYRHQPGDGYHYTNLLRDGAGRCQAWAELLQNVMQCQGLKCSQVAIFPPNPQAAVHGAALLFAGPSSWTTDSDNIATHSTLLPAQGGTDDGGAYNNHYLVIYPQIPPNSTWSATAGFVYDSSYGGAANGGAYGTLEDWRDASLFGYQDFDISSRFCFERHPNDANPSLSVIYNNP